MSPIPRSAFPLCGANSKAGGFVLAVLVGLAFYLSQQPKQPQTTTPR
jgi:hypothetical protein